MNRARRTALVRVISTDAPANEPVAEPKTFRAIHEECQQECRQIMRASNLNNAAREAAYPSAIEIERRAVQRGIEMQANRPDELTRAMQGGM
jgi:hypothetical protein